MFWLMWPKYSEFHFLLSAQSLLWQFKNFYQNPFLVVVLISASLVLALFLAFFCPCDPALTCSTFQASLLSHSLTQRRKTKCLFPEMLKITTQFPEHICSIGPESSTLARDRDVVITLNQWGFTSTTEKGFNFLWNI